MTAPLEQQRMAVAPPPAWAQAALQGRRDALLMLST
jgi:hypothetical protein